MAGHSLSWSLQQGRCELPLGGMVLSTGNREGLAAEFSRRDPVLSRGNAWCCPDACHPSRTNLSSLKVLTVLRFHNNPESHQEVPSSACTNLSVFFLLVTLVHQYLGPDLPSSRSCTAPRSCLPVEDVELTLSPDRGLALSGAAQGQLESVGS